MNIVSLSGGKDSTAMLLMMLEKGIKIDKILFCYTGKEFPEVYPHLQQIQDYIKPYGLEITVLKSDKSYDWYMYEYKSKYGKNKDKKGLGWASFKVRWCTGYLKTAIINNYLSQFKEPIYEYVGIAYDEPQRIKNYKNHIYPLVEWKMTEQDCLDYCYSKGFDFFGIYKHRKRASCWCCPLQNLKSLETLYLYNKDLWEELKLMDKKSNNQFRLDYSVEELEEKFKKKFEGAS